MSGFLAAKDFCDILQETLEIPKFCKKVSIIAQAGHAVVIHYEVFATSGEIEEVSKVLAGRDLEDGPSSTEEMQ